jgi:hypothetical protein
MVVDWNHGGQMVTLERFEEECSRRGLEFSEGSYDSDVLAEGLEPGPYLCTWLQLRDDGNMYEAVYDETGERKLPEWRRMDP